MFSCSLRRKSIFSKLIFCSLIFIFLENPGKAAFVTLNDTVRVVDYEGDKIHREKYFVNKRLVGQKDYYYKKKFYGYSLVLDSIGSGEEYVREFYPNGSLRIDKFIRKGEIEGIYKTYYENGKPQCICRYRDGKRDSIQLIHYSNGQLFASIAYRNGLPDEVIGMFDNKGEPVEKGSLKNGNGTLYVYTEQGQLEMIAHYRKGKIVRRELKNKKALFR